MSVETNAKFITEFNEAYPRRGDLIKEGDDHMRLIKSVLKNTLPNFNRTVNISSEKLNHIDSMIETTDNTLTIAGNITIKDKKTINMGDNIVTKVSDPVEDTDAVNKRYLKKEGVEFAWPVGSVYITMDTRDPKVIFGFGEWEQFASGRVLIGTGSDKDDNKEAKLIALGGKGGNYNETLSEKQIPAHKHSMAGVTVKTSPGGEHDHQIWSHDSTANDGGGGPNGEFVKAWNLRGSYPSGGAITGTDRAASHTHDATLEGEVSSVGGGEKHNNMMPYIGVNMWKRIK